MSIPPFELSGALPPIRPGASGESDDRSPYRATIVEVAQRFAHTDERKTIFHGFLRLRKALRQVGVTSGRQWLDGSFVEDCEVNRGRAPADIDVVSFLDLGDPKTARERLKSSMDLFDPSKTKQQFRVDHYVVQLGIRFDEGAARRVSYWYSMWSHRRDDQRWKGFLEVDIDEDDGPALALLDLRTTTTAKEQPDVA